MNSCMCMNAECICAPRKRVSSYISIVRFGLHKCAFCQPHIVLINLFFCSLKQDIRGFYLYGLMDMLLCVVFNTWLLSSECLTTATLVTRSTSSTPWLLLESCLFSYWSAVVDFLRCVGLKHIKYSSLFYKSWSVSLPTRSRFKDCIQAAPIRTIDPE